MHRLKLATMAKRQQRNEKGQFVVGNDAASKKWTTPEQLQKDIDAYFKDCDNHTVKEIVMGKVKEVPKPKPYTIEGLCCVLDCDRRTLLNYQKRKGYEPFFHTVNNAKRKVLKSLVENGLIYEAHASLIQFILKNNYEYVDKQEVEQSGQTEIVVKRPTK